MPPRISLDGYIVKGGYSTEKLKSALESVGIVITSLQVSVSASDGSEMYNILAEPATARPVRVKDLENNPNRQNTIRIDQSPPVDKAPVQKPKIRQNEYDDATTQELM